MIRGHHDKSNERNFFKLSEIISIASSDILVQPDKLSIVRLGSDSTINEIKKEALGSENNN